jgi:hypothetical protein
LYEQPQTTHVLAHHVNFVKKFMMAHTSPNNPRNVIRNTMILENIIPLQVPGITPSTPTFINKTSFNKKGPTSLEQSMGNKGVKRK